jgi:hypothetical protein
MFGFWPATKVYLALGATDMRKGFDGLYGLVRDRLIKSECGLERCVNTDRAEEANNSNPYQ